MKRNYRFWHAIFDLFMFVITGGWWLVWVIFRELNRTTTKF